jgi:hypothetical protein
MSVGTVAREGVERVRDRGDAACEGNVTTRKACG